MTPTPAKASLRTPIPVCQDLGVTRGQRGRLTGFTTHALQALAHLREAWRAADPTNEESIGASLRALLSGPALAERRALCATVLVHGLVEEEAQVLRYAVGFGREGSPDSSP
jgi:hypothetical protein